MKYTEDMAKGWLYGWYCGITNALNDKDEIDHFLDLETWLHGWRLRMYIEDGELWGCVREEPVRNEPIGGWIHVKMEGFH